MKPLIRWIIGPCHSRGLEILQHSVVSFHKLYKNRFDLMICYNQIDKPEFRFDFDVKYYDQVKAAKYDGIDFNVVNGDTWAGTGWKLCPPRIRLKSHEIILDNDEVFIDKPDLIEQFLDSDTLLGFAAHHRAYGGLDRYQPTRFPVDPDLKLNSGLIGLPPCFDFAEQLKSIYDGKPVIRHDEQGLVAAIFSKFKHQLIGFEDMLPLDETAYFKQCKVAHFIHANSAQGHHKAWATYRDQQA